MADEYDHDEIPNHQLPRMPSDLQISSGQHNYQPNFQMADLQNPSGHHNNLKMNDNNSPSGQYNHQPNFEMIDPGNPSGHFNQPKMNEYSRPSSHHSNNRPTPPPRHLNGRPPQYPPPGGPLQHHPYGKHNNNNNNNDGRQPQYSLPPPHPYNRKSPSKAGAFAAIATVILLLALTALILYLVYRPKTPHFSVVAASIYLLNSTATLNSPSTACFLAASVQFTVVTRNTHSHTSLYYDHLTAQVFYKDQPITPPSDLQPLEHTPRTTVVFSPVLGAGEPMPVAPGVGEQLEADETYGMVGLRLVLMGRVKYKAGPFRSAHYGVYVGCDVLVGLKKGAALGPVPLLANHDCKLDM